MANNAALPDPWPFDQAPNVAAIISAQVLSGAPITHVYHMEDDDSWVFLHDIGIATADGKVVGMGTAIKMDLSLTEISDLPPGWVAIRQKRGSPWAKSRQ